MRVWDAVAARGAGVLLLVFALFTIGVLTLAPAGNYDSAGTPYCLICGDRGLADAILNIALFMPLGAGIALLGWRPRAAALTGSAFSLLVEAAQYFLPGRDASIGDLLTNSLGALLGARLVVFALSWRFMPRRRRLQLAAAWAAGVAVMLCGTSFLLTPAPTDDRYYVQWRARLGHLGHYQGDVLEAALGMLPLPEGDYPADMLVPRIFGGFPVALRFTAALPTIRLSPILSIYDEQQREILLVGADGEDLVLRYRTRAAALRLDFPETRIRGVLAGYLPGAEIPLSVRHDGSRGWDVQIDGQVIEHAGFTLADGYQLLLQSQRPLANHPRAMRILWLLCWSAPLGLALVSARRAPGSRVVSGDHHVRSQARASRARQRSMRA